MSARLLKRITQWLRQPAGNPLILAAWTFLAICIALHILAAVGRAL